MQATGVTRDAFTETGVGGLSLAVAREKRDLYTATAEGRLSNRTEAFGGVVEPYVGVGAVCNFGDRDTLSAMRFTGAPTGSGAFTITGAKVGKYTGLLSGGVEVRPSRNVTMGVGVESQLSNRYREGRASVHIRIGF